MPRKPIEPELQHDLGGAQRPAPLALDVFETFQKTTHVEQHAGEFRADRLEREVDLLARRDDGVGEGASSALAAPALRPRGIPA